MPEMQNLVADCLGWAPLLLVVSYNGNGGTGNVESMGDVSLNLIGVTTAGSRDPMRHVIGSLSDILLRH